jgi:hypothetical protein
MVLIITLFVSPFSPVAGPAVRTLRARVIGLRRLT